MGKTRTLTGALLAIATLTATGCSGGGTPSAETASAPADASSASGTITVLTQRTDLIKSGAMKAYAAEFNKIYPRIEVKFEGLTDYEGEVKIRMNTDKYGDVLMIPGAVAKNDYPKFFAPLGSSIEMADKYRFSDKSEVNGKTYGVAQFGTANGFVYNKALWKKAGVTAWPRTPEEFLSDLRAVKSKTGAIPYYTNFKDGWPLVQWSANIGSVTCSEEANNKLAGPVSPWKSGSELAVIDTLLFDIVKDGLSEKDPSTTNWEASKGKLAKGEIGSMMVGSWAISQMRDAAEKAGKNADDIGYMPVPVQREEGQCATLVSDYQQAVNIHSEHKEAARAWIDWFTEKSGYSAKEGAVPTLKSAPMPDTLKEFVDNDVTFVERSESKTGTVNEIDNAAEIGLNTPDYRQKLIDIARGAQKGSVESYFAELDKKWDEAAKTVGS
ncbi:carbohydrate ABC transporter substrate-binding protein (CUT1 family) [Streptomyces sp. KhCrAH-43]|uniref:ABC transporter substrate-binding protein n=1 Tax=unclassified Streptomyces TaxID=2593676 RepID=UPI00037A0C00|nr:MULTISPECIES: ABC transporter substrate-binding protein [unclassified Streptomyces]MYS35670.1 extracellular solute-binding protein [Streptomyces sp. SID4920]MYX68747.1 extracellular solute-binding protein [Streptomyces sp. SID8373]RAJ55025.1 carbohydrate ABC transporter substrate-binding protein (CUT1 family) [Streptomyces sp. KhCrAH-43]